MRKSERQVEASLFSQQSRPMLSLDDPGVQPAVQGIICPHSLAGFGEVENSLVLAHLVRHGETGGVSPDELRLITVQMQTGCSAAEAATRLGWTGRKYESVTRQLRRHRATLKKNF